MLYRAGVQIALLRRTAAALLLCALPVAATADASLPACSYPFDLVRLSDPLPHVAKHLAAREPIVIVAVGSSSTSGAGASSPAKSYPSRLDAELKRLLPQASITVINRGVGGEEIKDVLRRFASDVIALKPDLVLWQLGTNSVIRDHPLIDHGASIRDGINDIKLAGADVILIDPQFAPKVIVKPDAARMVDLIARTAKSENVDLFHRFALMQHWHDVNRMPFSDFVSADGLHMNDWSYGCLAKSLAAAIADAATRPAHTAISRAR